jgi:hypothetical protein
MAPFHGKYRGVVANNVDPSQLARVQVSVPSVFGPGRMAWAMPCVPYAGKRVGWFVLPPLGANVWVEFEGGDPDLPIWTGCFWGTADDLPANPPIAETKVLRTESTTVTISDLPGAGGVTMQVNPPAVPLAVKVSIDVHGVVVSVGPSSVTVSLAETRLTTGAASVHLSPTTVSINNGALEVT